MTNKNIIRNEIDKISNHLDIIMADLVNVIALLRDNNLMKEADYFDGVGQELYIIKESINQLRSYF